MLTIPIQRFAILPSITHVALHCPHVLPWKEEDIDSVMSYLACGNVDSIIVGKSKV